jgi:hypothetical protein
MVSRRHSAIGMTARADVNCPQHIPQNLDAADVAKVVAELRDSIMSVEAENERLRGQLASRMEQSS